MDVLVHYSDIFSETFRGRNKSIVSLLTSQKVICSIRKEHLLVMVIQQLVSIPAMFCSFIFVLFITVWRNFQTKRRKTEQITFFKSVRKQNDSSIAQISGTTPKDCCELNKW